MTQNSFAAVARISATLDALTEALLDDQATRYPVGSLTGWDRGSHPAASGLFGLRLGRPGPAGPSADATPTLTLRGLGTVVAGATSWRPAPVPGLAEQLLARYGGGPVRGAVDGVDPGRFQLPVIAESADAALRPPFPIALEELAHGATAADGRATDLAPDLLPAGAGVEVRLALPPVFHALTAWGERPADQLAETAEEVFAQGPDEGRRDWAVTCGALAEIFAEAGVVFAGIAALQADGRPTQASLVVSLTPSESTDGPTTEQLAERLAESHPQAEFRTVRLPAGPAVVLVEARTAPVPAPLTVDGKRRWAVSSVAEAFLPLPDGNSVLTVQLGTVRAEDWSVYATAFSGILHSIQLGWDGLPTGSAQATAGTSQTAPVASANDAGIRPQAVSPPAPAQPVETTIAPVIPPRPTIPPAVPAPPASANGTSTLMSPRDVDPFGASPAPVAAPAAANDAPKGTAVNIPPPDFNPFAPPTPTTAPTSGNDSQDTTVNIPPPDFNPFGAVSSPATPVPATAAPASVVQPAKPQNADPFGTVITNEPQDPFGTVTRNAPPRPTLIPPQPTPPPASPLAESAAPGKGIVVNVPPPDFNPFAPPAPPSPAVAAEEPAAPGKGIAVNVPPPDFNPFAPPAPPSSAAVTAPTASPTPEPPANSPFG